MSDAVSRLLDGNDAMNASSYSADNYEEEGDFHGGRSSSDEPVGGYSAEPASKKAKLNEHVEFPPMQTASPFGQPSMAADSRAILQQNSMPQFRPTNPPQPGQLPHNVGFVPRVTGLAPHAQLVPPMYFNHGAAPMPHGAIPQPPMPRAQLPVPAPHPHVAVHVEPGTKYSIGADTEYIIPDEGTWHSYAWWKARVIKRGVREIGQLRLPYYVVKHEPFGGDPNGQETTVEEWQMRDTSKERAGFANQRIRKGAFIEVSSEFSEAAPAKICWFMAQSLEESPAEKPNVRVQFLNERWNVEDRYRVVDKSRVRMPPANDELTRKSWEKTLPLKILSDEEHKVEELYTRLKEIKRTVEQVSIKTPYDFEVYREELNDIIDSFNNANYYEYSMEGIALILEVFKRLKSGGK